MQRVMGSTIKTNPVMIATKTGSFYSLSLLLKRQMLLNCLRHISVTVLLFTLNLAGNFATLYRRGGGGGFR